MQIEIPVLLLIFNRPDNTSQVFEAIRRAKPAQLFVAADGPRKSKEGEMELCLQARTIATQVDWPCDVKILFRDENLGCKLAVSSGISWFFEHVEMGIILEDDCKPDPTFFGFCSQMLRHYNDDLRIMMICGTNYLSDEISSKIEHSYFFANYYPIWGWATWKRAWLLYDVKMTGWDKFRNTKQLFWLFGNAKISMYYQSMFDLIKNGFDTWDIQWWYTCIFQSGLAVIPKYNLISNIGVEGTHSGTQGDFCIKMPTHSLNLNKIIHPEFITADKYLNEMTYKMSHAQVDVSEEGNKHTLLNGHMKPGFIKGVVKSIFRKIYRKINPVNFFF